MNYFPTATLSETTKTNYNKLIARWLSFGIPNIEELVKDSENAIKVLQKSDVKQTNYVYHGYYSAIVSYLYHEAPESLKPYKTLWKDLQKENHKPIADHYLAQEPTENQKETELDWAEIIKMRDSLPLGIERLLIGFYSYIPPVRADYYATALLKPEEPVPEKENYIILGSDYKLVIQNFKTQKRYGTIEHILPEALKKELEESLKVEPRKWLFIKRRESKSAKEEPMTPNEYSGWANRILSRVFGKRTNITAFRHAFTSTIDYNGGLREISRVAHSMGHSVEMSHRYVWRR
jgi:integrase